MITDEWLKYIATDELIAISVSYRTVQQIARELLALREAVRWALGYTPATGEPFLERKEGEGAYWWRNELRERCGSALPAAPEVQA